MDATYKIIQQRYELLKTLGRGGMGEVYLTLDRLTGEKVALKRLILASNRAMLETFSDTDEFAVSLANEFQVLAGMRHPNIVRVLDYGFENNHAPFFTMEYITARRNILVESQAYSDDEKIDFLSQLLQGVEYLHRRNIIHRDLKPPNVMLVDGNVKIIDFGLAIDPTASDTPVGTLTYLAPELLQGNAPSIQSDLYAVGLIGYGFFNQDFPFRKGQSITTLVNDIVNQTVDCSMIDERVRAVIEKLMAKSLDDRYRTATDALNDIHQNYPLSDIIRLQKVQQSYLEAATYVGRHEELAYLRTGLNTLRDGKGSMWLVGGESGVGKSRLVDEFRTRALVQGVQVTRGYTEDNGNNFQTWFDPLKVMSLTTDVNLQDASILKIVIPDLERILDTDIPEAPMLSADANQQRIIGAILNLIRSRQEPIIIILEDIHWMPNRAEILEPLSRLIDTLPIMLIATYRSDEVPYLPSELPLANLVEIERLTRSERNQLAFSMLGDAGTQPDLLALLDRETEGNAFFMVEIIKTLASEAGTLSKIAHMSLPESVFSGGIQKVIQRRLQKLPRWAYRGLQVAALHGRHLDVALLSTIIRDNFNFESKTHFESIWDHWLLICVEASILEVVDNQWRFTHDKIRNQTIADISDKDRHSYSRILATTLENIYPNKVETAAALSRHWGTAGDYDKSAQFGMVAGEFAIYQGNIAEAIAIFERMLSIDDKTEFIDRHNLLNRLGEAYRMNSQLDQANECYQTVIDSQLDDKDLLAQAWTGLAWVQQTQGYDQLSYDSASKAESLLMEMDYHDGGMLAEILYHKGWAAFRLERRDEALAIGEQGLKIARDIFAQQEIGYHLNLLSIVHGFMFSHYDTASEYQVEALEIHRLLSDRQGESIMLNNMAEIASLQGNYEQAASLYADALEIAESLGDKDLTYAFESNLYGAQVMFADCEPLIPLLTTLIHKAPDDWYILPDTYCHLAQAYINTKNYDNALDVLQLALALEDLPSDSRARHWRLLANVLAAMKKIIDYEGEILNADSAYQKSLDVLQDTTFRRDIGLILWHRGRYQRQLGNHKVAKDYLSEALAIFQDLNLTTFAAYVEALLDE